jgi:hypothetical protein
VSMYQAGGRETTTTNSIDEVLARVFDYAEAVKAAPVPYSALILDYGTLDLPQGPTLVEIETAQIVLMQFVRQRTALLTLQSDISYIRENPEQFVSPDLAALNEAAADIADRLNRLKDNATAAARNVTEAEFIDVGIPAIELPQRKEGTPKPPPSGIPVTVPDFVGGVYGDVYPYPNEVSHEPFASIHSNFTVTWIRGIPMTGYDGAAGRIYEQRPAAGASAFKGDELTLWGYEDGN